MVLIFLENIHDAKSRNDDIRERERERVGVAPIVEKFVETRLSGLCI